MEEKFEFKAGSWVGYLVRESASAAAFYSSHFPSIVHTTLYHPSTPGSLAHGKSVTVPCLQVRTLCVVLLGWMIKMVEYFWGLHEKLRLTRDTACSTLAPCPCVCSTVDGVGTIKQAPSRMLPHSLHLCRAGSACSPLAPCPAVGGVLIEAKWQTPRDGLRGNLSFQYSLYRTMPDSIT